MVKVPGSNRPFAKALSKGSAKVRASPCKKEAVKIRNRFFFVVLALAALLVFLVVKPLITVILTAAVFAYIFYPLQKWLSAKTGKQGLTAMLIVLVLIFLTSVPTVLIFNAMTKEVLTGYAFVKQSIVHISLNEHFAEIYSNPQVRGFVNTALNKISTSIINRTSDFVLVLSQKIFYAFILFFLLYYFLKDGGKLAAFFGKLKFEGSVVHGALLSKLKETTYAVVYSTIIVAVVQGVAAGIGFWLIGAPSPVLFGALTIFAALVPFLGAVAVWLPISVYMIVNGYLHSSGWGVASGLILLAYGTLVTSMIDNILKPRIISKRAGIHPALVLLGVIGGISVFGMIGVVVGPVVIAMLVTLFEVYIKERMTWN